MTTAPLERTYHASSVILCFTGLDTPFGLLIEGESAAGKSSLVLDLITLGTAGALGLSSAQLVGDDQIVLASENGELTARPAQRLKGLMEVRGLGLLRLPHAEKAVIGLRLRLVEDADRLPLRQDLISELEGISLPTLALYHGSHRAQIATLAAHALVRGRKLDDFAEAGVPFAF